jgi:intracellular septation protein A
VTWGERLGNIYKVALGAAFAFFISYYVWDRPEAQAAAMIATAIWVAAYFMKDRIDRNSGGQPNG